MNDDGMKGLLESMADEVHDVRPLTRSALRRARARRMALAATTVVSVLGLAVAGTGLALSLSGPGGGGSIAPAGNSTPPPPNPMPGTVVAHGESGDGGEWWLSADAPDSGDICTYLQHDTGDMQQDCRAYATDADQMGFGRDKLKDGVFGWVPDDTTKLWVTDSVEYVDGGPEDEEPEDEGEESEGEETVEENDESNGEETVEGSPKDVRIEGEEELQLYDAPEDFPYPVEFYALVPAPENAETLLIKLNDQDMVALIVGRPPYDPDDESNERTLVAEGEHGGYSWELYEKVKDDDLRCLDLRWADERFGSGAGCSSAVPDDESFQFVMVHFGEDNIAFFAAVAEEVERLEIVRDDGEVETLDIVEGPEGSVVDYVVGWPSLDEDGGLHGSARTLDEDGHVLDTMRLCELGGPSSGCSSDYRP